MINDIWDLYERKLKLIKQGLLQDLDAVELEQEISFDDAKDDNADKLKDKMVHEPYEEIENEIYFDDAEILQRNKSITFAPHEEIEDEIYFDDSAGKGILT
ncbi:uncharacterized protein TNCV_3183131 [Trichonephila clavipes]|uniref:Uncharacterized protein n=1 Tax=Trichonephila clavipes TaxID=2585209 RepID=A0A8X6SHU8_TRICX|nr:uncharacterized protein TNCV_3183131 [Trichonephila clavipes]